MPGTAFPLLDRSKPGVQDFLGYLRARPVVARVLAGERMDDTPEARRERLRLAVEFSISSAEVSDAIQLVADETV